MTSNMKTGLVARPWILVVVGLGALLLHAAVASPEEMLVFDPPMIAFAIGYWLLAMRPAGADAQQPRPIGPVRKVLVVLLILFALAGLGYIARGRVHDSGIVGWLDAFQARHGGTYREKTSVVTAFGYLMMAYGLGTFAALRLGLRRAADGPRP